MEIGKILNKIVGKKGFELQVVRLYITPFNVYRALLGTSLNKKKIIKLNKKGRKQQNGYFRETNFILYGNYFKSYTNGKG